MNKNNIGNETKEELKMENKESLDTTKKSVNIETVKSTVARTAIEINRKVKYCFAIITRNDTDYVVHVIADMTTNTLYTIGGKEHDIVKQVKRCKSKSEIYASYAKRIDKMCKKSISGRCFSDKIHYKDRPRISDWKDIESIIQEALSIKSFINTSVN